MPPEDTDKTSALEDLRRKLYSPTTPGSVVAPSLTPLSPEIPIAGEGWAPPVAPLPKKKSRVSLAVMFLVLASVFFVLAIASAAYFLVFGGRSVSSDRVIITIDGPSVIASGDTVSLLISIQNNNPVSATETSLSVEFPETARDPENKDQVLSHYADTVGEIAAGDAGQRTVRAVLFGAEQERVSLPVRFEYRVAGSNAVFVKEATYEAIITSSPLSVRAEAVSEASAGQPLTFAVHVQSNAKTQLEHVAVLAQYPFGFTPKRGEGPLFAIGTLEPGEERTITVSGTLSGENNEERVFRFTGGTRKAEDSPVLAISYSTAETTVTLAKPFLSTTLSLNRDTSSAPVIAVGEQVQGLLSWANTLSSPVLDGQVSVRLTGSALEATSVSAYGGYYRSSDTTILFSRETDRGLGQLNPGDTGGGSFSFSTKNASAMASMRNPTIIATISVAGRRVGEANVPEQMTSTLVRTIKVGTDFSLVARSLRTAGPFTNTGPWPPVADTESTYTIEFALANTVNSVGGAVVSGTLPSYVRYLRSGQSDGSITYNATTRTVTWNAGDVPAGTGNGSTPKTAAVQVALLPSVSQRGTSPILMSTVTLSGTDRFTQKALSSVRPDVTTQSVTDPSYQPGNGEVQ